jgi:hypothetical protein
MKSLRCFLIIAFICFFQQQCIISDFWKDADATQKKLIKEADSLFAIQQFDSAKVKYLEALRNAVYDSNKVYLREALKKVEFELNRELIVTDIKFRWKKGHWDKKGKDLIISGHLMNLSNNHIFDQIIRSFCVKIKFKNGYVKKIEDYANTIDKNEANLTSLLTFGWNNAFKSFIKKRVLRPKEKIYFILGDNEFGADISLGEKMLMYPIEKIELTLYAEARTPLNHVWRGRVISCEVPLP